MAPTLARNFRLAATPIVLAAALVCAGLGYLYRYKIIEPAEMGAACETLAFWWCVLRLKVVFFTQSHGLGYVALGLAGLALLLPVRWSFPAVMATMIAAGFGLTLYNATGAGVALVLTLARSAWLDKRRA